MSASPPGPAGSVHPRPFPPFIFLLLGLGIVELAAAYITQTPPGALMRMGARILAFALGLGILILITGRLA